MYVFVRVKVPVIITCVCLSGSFVGRGFLRATRFFSRPCKCRQSAVVVTSLPTPGRRFIGGPGARAPVIIWVGSNICWASNIYFGTTWLFNFYPKVTTLRSGLCYRNSVCRLSVCRLSFVTLVHPTQGLKLSAKFLHRCVRWPSSDLRARHVRVSHLLVSSCHYLGLFSSQTYKDSLPTLA